MWAFLAPEFDVNKPEYIIAWEDLNNLGDADYNDLVLVIHFLDPSVITCCEDDDDCDDGIFCNGVEFCSAGVCQVGDDPCPDDGLFCNGVEGCDEEGALCTHSGDPCAQDIMCDEERDLCVGCLEDEDCDDGLFCNGEEYCSEGICVHSENPCPAETECNEAARSCDPITTTTTTVPPLPKGKVVIMPEKAEVVSKGIQQFYAITATKGKVVKSNYKWKIVSDSGIGSTISKEGLYAAGENKLGKPLHETIRAFDTHYEFYTHANITVHSIDISIVQEKEVVDAGGTVQFGATTVFEGEVVESMYVWEIDPLSAIGSSINGEGLYAAGTPGASSPVIETVRVFDCVFGISATADVTVTPLVVPVPEEFVVTIAPQDTIIAPQGSINFSAATEALTPSFGTTGTASPAYEWSITSEIGSVIAASTGVYTAGKNEVGRQVYDIITVVDHANNDATSSCEVIVTYGEITFIFPSTILASRWIPLPYTFLLLGKHLTIDSFYTLLRFEPDDDIEPLSKFGFGDFMLCTIVLSPNPSAQEGNIILDTDGEFAVSRNLTLRIDMLPWILDEENRAK